MQVILVYYTDLIKQKQKMCNWHFLSLIWFKFFFLNFLWVKSLCNWHFLINLVQFFFKIFCEWKVCAIDTFSLIWFKFFCKWKNQNDKHCFCFMLWWQSCCHRPWRIERLSTGTGALLRSRRRFYTARDGRFGSFNVCREIWDNTRQIFGLSGIRSMWPCQ